MSQFSNIPTADPSASDYDEILGNALNDYKKQTGQDLGTHTFALKPSNFGSPEAVLEVLRDKVQAFDDDNEMLMTWLESYVHLLFTVSRKLWESTETRPSLEKTICTAIAVLFDIAYQVEESSDTLVELFDTLQLCLQRIDNFTETYTTGIKVLLLKVMAEALSTLAVHTKRMKEKPIRKMLKILVRKKDINKLPRHTMNKLTNEVLSKSLEVQLLDSSSAMAIGEPIHDAGDAIQEDDRHVDNNGLAIPIAIGDTTKSLALPEADRKGGSGGGSTVTLDQRNKDKLLQWLTPPDPSANHDTACKSRHAETGKWFFRDRKFKSWKKKGSFLLIWGDSGSGKTILCSSIIEDVKRTLDKSDMIAYYYIDSKDPAKCDLRGLLASLLTQLGDNSGLYLNAISQLHRENQYGSEQPSEETLARLLKGLLDLQAQYSIYIIIDGVDNCSNTETTGTKSARKKVLEFLEDLVRSKHSHLYICITSSPVKDMQRTLKLLAPSTRRVVLHEEDGQMEDIKLYISHVVQKDMQTWPAKDRDLIVETLSERAGGIFRWVSHRLNTLRESIPSQIRNIREEMGTPLDAIIEQALHDIPDDKYPYAYRLFQCLVVALPSNRSFGLKELADIFNFSTDLDPNAAPNVEVVLSACSALVTTDDKDPESVHFSHPIDKVEEFLTSNRLQTSNLKTISRYHFSLETANATLSRACIDVLLQFDLKADKERLKSYPLALYAAQHWVDHTQIGKVESKNQDVMRMLLDTDKSHLDAWIWMHDIDKDQSRTMDDLASQPSRRKATPLYYAALCGFGELVSYLADKNPDDVADERGYYGTPLHAASYKGHSDAVRALLKCGAKVDKKINNKTPIHAAYYGGWRDTMELLLLAKDTDVDARGASGNTLLHYAALDGDGRLDLVDLLLGRNPDLNAKNENGWTPLHRAALRGQVEIAKRLLEKDADVNIQSKNNNTPLHVASIAGKLEVVNLLLQHKADMDIQGENGRTPLQAAKANRNEEIVDRLNSGSELRRHVFDKLRQLYPM